MARRRSSITVRGLHEREYQAAAGAVKGSHSEPALTREGRWLELLAWVAATLRELRRDGCVFEREEQQFVALSGMKRWQLARIPDSDSAMDLRMASRAVWAAQFEVCFGQAAA